MVPFGAWSTLRDGPSGQPPRHADRHRHTSNHPEVGIDAILG